MSKKLSKAKFRTDSQNLENPKTLNNLELLKRAKLQAKNDPHIPHAQALTSHSLPTKMSSARSRNASRSTSRAPGSRGPQPKFPSKQFVERIPNGHRCRVCAMDKLWGLLQCARVAKSMDDNTGSLAFAGNDALLYGLYSSGYNSTTAWRHLNTLHGFPSDGIGEDPNLSDCNPAMIRFLDRCVEIGDQYNWGSWGVNFYNGLKSKALTPSIDKTLQNLNLTFDERAAEFIAENYLPFTVVDSGSFSRLFPDGSATTRQKVTEAARAFAARSMGAALAGKLRNVCHLFVPSVVVAPFRVFQGFSRFRPVAHFSS